MKITWELDLSTANLLLQVLGEMTGMSWKQMNGIIVPLQEQTQKQLAAVQSTGETRE